MKNIVKINGQLLFLSLRHCFHSISWEKVNQKLIPNSGRVLFWGKNMIFWLAFMNWSIEKAKSPEWLFQFFSIFLETGLVDFLIEVFLTNNQYTLNIDKKDWKKAKSKLSHVYIFQFFNSCSLIYPISFLIALKEITV